MAEIFLNCSSLFFLPDISKWNTNKVIDIRYLFFGCSSLFSLPDISKWNINNVTNACLMLTNCISLISLPDLSNKFPWKNYNEKFINEKVDNEKMNDYMNFNFDFTISSEKDFEKSTDYQLIFTKKR